MATELINYDAAKLANRARTTARKAWGRINTQKKVSAWVWEFDTEGHGGYVYMVPAGWLQDWMTPYIDQTWSIRQTGDPVMYGLVFEEDEAWAVLEYKEPHVLNHGYTYDRSDIFYQGFPTIDSYREYVVAHVTKYNPKILTS